MTALDALPHEMILASAGSGKTYQLTNRYIALMAIPYLGGRAPEPERIIATTFSVAAAGEFFDAILQKLAKAALDPAFAASLGGDPLDPLASILAHLKSEDYRALLRVFIDRMPRLFLGTLDSFFSRVLRAFPGEFGIGADFEILNDYRIAAAKEEVYGAIFGRDQGDAQDQFLAAFRLANFGKEEFGVRRSLDPFVKKLHSIYLKAPGQRFWGQADTIWAPGQARFLSEETIDPVAECRRLVKALATAPSGLTEPDRWPKLEEQLAAHVHGVPFAGEINYFSRKWLEHWDVLEAGGPQIKFNRKFQDFSPVACEAAIRIMQWLIGGAIKVKLRRTAGVWELLDIYERTYTDLVRRRGKLTFEDVQLLLAGNECVRRGAASGQVIPRLSQGAERDEDARLRIDYRLDAAYDHWLLDEFQDTNFLQWGILGNLIDEVIQDSSGTRSVFMVGDTKQSIYAFRGSDPTLLTDIESHYNQNQIRLKTRLLDVSYRSCLDVLGPVNQVFRDTAAMAAMGVPQAALDRWKWREHLVGSDLEAKPGYTAYLNPLPDEAGGEVSDEEIFGLALAILQEVDPMRLGLSCAVLFAQNEASAAFADYVRRRSDLVVTSGAKQTIATDNSLNLAQLSYFQVAAHPGDTFAWEHLRMSPYRAVIGRMEHPGPGSLARRVVASIFAENFEVVSRRFVADLDAAMRELGEGGLDDFSLHRAESFALAAREFDRSGSRDIDEFSAFVRAFQLRDTGTKGAIVLSTIHGAKGLTYDMVILPDIGRRTVTKTEHGIAARSGADRAVRWVLDMPLKDIVQADPELSCLLAEREAEVAYEAICLFYVAMTRARYANYLICEPQKATSVKKNFIRLLQDTLAHDPQPIAFAGVAAELRYQSNTELTDRRWFDKVAVGKVLVEADAVPLSPAAWASPRPHLRKRTPSGAEDSRISAAQLLSLNGAEARNFGTLVHAMFESIEWLEPDTMAKLQARWPDAVEARGQVEATLASADGAVALRRPSSTAEVWRERNFEMVIEGEWLSGTFDRVVIERHPDGRFVAAMIYDFKTDQLDREGDLVDLAQKYQAQMLAYAEVLARLTGLPKSEIGLVLLSTRLGKAIQVTKERQ
jgi:ATP-dependent helicase/nuclease subunit A